jgi:pyrimidine-specific ribonucleoside hydrolase
VAGTDAVALMARLLDESPEPVTIVPIGPLTNIALLLAAHPSVQSKIERLVIMGGGLAGGNVTPAAEFNIWSDPEAARRVLAEESVPTTVVPLDMTMQCMVDGAWLDALAAGGTRGATLVNLSAQYRAHYQRSMGREGIVIHDAVAVAEAVRPGLLSVTRLPVDVECGFGPARGMTIADRRGAEATHEVDVALSADLDEVRAFLLSRLSG